MRLVSFLILSLTLHAAALAFPISFGGKSPVEVMHVTILPVEQELMGASSLSASASAAPGAVSNSPMRKPRNLPRKTEAKRNTGPEPQAIPAEAAAQVHDSSVALVSAIASFHGAAIFGFQSTGADGSASGSAGSSNDGLVSSGAGSGPASDLGSSGTGSGSANGQGSSGNGILSQARYRDTPRPDYPESARREGREGRVLLRVLVDHQGRSKQVEINSSSGSAALDGAAAEAIRRWRFHPARRGDQPVESWLRIPVEFRLADAKSR